MGVICLSSIECAFMSLIKQCEKLSLLYEEVVLNYSGMPEKAALKFFEKQGYVGYCNEIHGCPGETGVSESLVLLL
jgi:hypothetical protein